MSLATGSDAAINQPFGWQSYNRIKNHFASTSVPADIQEGQLWWDKTNAQLKVKKAAGAPAIVYPLSGLILEGTIIPWIGGYFGDGSNGGYTPAMGANTVLAVNTWANPLGWYVCDGAPLNTALSTIFNGANRYLPNLTDSRFLQGYTESGAIGGENANSHTHGVGSIAAANESAHTHGPGSFATPVHYHGITSISVVAEASHTHGGGSMAAANESSHTHGGTGRTTGAESAGHTHGGTTVGESNDHTHNYLDNGGGYSGTSGRSLGHTHDFSTGGNSAGHTHDISIPDGAGSAHSHAISGATGAGSSHTHALSGSTDNAAALAIGGASAAGSAHTHSISGTSAAPGDTENRPKFLNVFYLMYILATP